VSRAPVARGPVGEPILLVSVSARMLAELAVGHDVVALDRFGDSAPGDVVMEKLGFTPEHIVSRALEALERSKDGAER